MREGTSKRVVFLDFDGVLHPSGGPPGECLPFCWVPHLAEELEAFPDVGGVSHSSWIERFTMEEMREFLEPLSARVLGTVWPGPKPQAILSYLSMRPDIGRCLIIDDDPTQFSKDFPVRLLVCDPRKGLSAPETRQQLREWLAHGDRETNGKSHLVTTAQPDDWALPELWTAWCDYYATGEGRTIMACVAFASSEAEIRQQFAKLFGEGYEKRCEAQHGVIRNACTEFLWSDAALKYMRRAAKPGSLVGAYSMVRVNLS